MPNHITTIVHIESRYEDEDQSDYETKKAKIVSLYNKLQTEQSKFDFNALIPMPKSLHITSGTSTEIGLACWDNEEFEKLSKQSWMRDRLKGASSPEELRKAYEGEPDVIKEGKIASENVKKYGHATWYTWANENWGTKWNAYSVAYLDDYSDDQIYGEILVKIETAWCPPYPILRKLSEDFDVRYTWKDEGSDEWHNWETIQASTELKKG